MKKCIIYLSLFFLVLFLTSISAEAEKDKFALKIIIAQADLDTGILKIYGEYFGANPLVTLEYQPLSVIYSEDMYIEAQFSISIDPGTYRLWVADGTYRNPENQMGSMDLTIGTQGPIGAEGPQGETGIQGETGLQGIQGETGQKGDTGATGPAGPTLGIYYSLGLASSGSRSPGDADGKSLYNLGNVGIGTISLGEKLEINGNVKANKVIYSSPRTHYFSIGGSDFNANGDRNYIVGGGLGLIYSGTGSMYAPVHLPDGAAVVEFKVFFYDVSSYDVTAELKRITHFGTNSSTMATVLSSGIGGFISAAETTILNDSIFNANYSYYVRINATWDAYKLRVSGVRIKYEISEAN